MHPDLALEFARWLSPDFAIWCNRTVRRIMAGGEAPVGVDLAGVARVLDRVVASHEHIVATQMKLMERLEQLEARPLPAPAAAPAPALIAPSPGPWVPGAAQTPGIEHQVARVLLRTIPLDKTSVWLHPVQIAHAAVHERAFANLIDEPSEYQQVSRFLRFLTPRYMRRWLDTGRGVWVHCEPVGRNRHRRYLVTSRAGHQPEGGPR